MKSVEEILNKNSTLNDEVILEVVNSALGEATKKSSEQLQALLAQKEKLELEIRHKTQELHTIHQTTFESIESSFRDHYEELNPKHLQKLTELKLESIDILDFLSEIIESAFINAIESGINIENSFREITRDITYKTLRDGYLSLDRAKHVISTIVAVASEMAQASPNQATAMLRGSIYGAKKGLTQSIHEFKERFAFIPDEANPIQLENLQQSFDDLQNADTLFIQTIQEQARLTDPTINEAMNQILDKMHSDLSDLVNASKETLVLISDRLAKFGKTAVKKGEKVLQSKVAIEAKRMGINVWDRAKGAVGSAINSAKDAIDKNNKK